MLKTLLNNEDEFYFFEFDYPNALKFNELDKEFQEKMKEIKTIEEIEKILSKKELKVFCGSLYMLGNIFSNIKL